MSENINAIPGKFPALFALDIEPLLMSDVEVNQTFLNVPGGASCKVARQASNPTNHDIVLKNRTVLGKLQLVKSVTPLEVVHKELPEQNELIYLKALNQNQSQSMTVI